MNWAHVHLVVNHVPAVLIFVALAMLILPSFRRSEGVTEVGLGLLVVAAIITGGVYLTGEPAEDVIENLPGVSRPAIEEHEEAAELAGAATAVPGLLAAAVLIARRRRRSLPPWIMIATIVSALAAGGLMVRAASLGGYIRHPEIAGRLMPDGLIVRRDTC